MKKILFCSSILCLLTIGCSTVGSDNDYLASVPQEADSKIVGVWVAGAGPYGPYLTTMKINSNGTGVLCYSLNRRVVLYKLIYNGSAVIMQTGDKFGIDSFNANQFNVTTSHFPKQKYTFHRDDNYTKSSVSCEANVK